MYPNTQVFLHNLSAARASLRRVSWGYGNNLGASLFHFALKELPEHPQPCVVSAQGEVMIASHKTEVQVLNSDQCVSVRKLTGYFVPEVATSVGNMVVLLSDLERGFAPTPRPLLPTRESALGNSKFPRSPQPLRVLDKFAVRQSKKTMQPDVDADLSSLALGDLGVGQFNLKQDIPLTETALDDDVLDFRVSGNLSVVLDFDITDILDVEHRTTVIVGLDSAPVAVSELEAMPAVTALEPGEAGGFTGLDTAEECAVRFVEPTKRLLQAGSIEHPKSVRVSPTEVSEIQTLSRESYTRSGFLVDLDALFKRRVVHVARQIEKIVHLLSLSGMRVQTVLERADHVMPLLAPQCIFLSFLRRRFPRFQHNMRESTETVFCFLGEEILPAVGGLISL
jgi:hypothetical protein